MQRALTRDSSSVDIVYAINKEEVKASGYVKANGLVSKATTTWINIYTNDLIEGLELFILETKAVPDELYNEMSKQR